MTDREKLTDAMNRMAAGESVESVQAAHPELLFHVDYGGGSPTCRCECGSREDRWTGRGKDGQPRPLCEHRWDGPVKEFDEGRGSTATCSRCGMWAYSHSLRTGP